MHAHPFDLPDDFPYAEMGRDYATGEYTIDEMAERYDVSRETFLAIRRAAPKTWTKGGANLWWDEMDAAEGELARRASAEQKAARVDRKARRRHRRETGRAARRWWQLEEAIEEAAERFRAEPYATPRLAVRVGSCKRLGPAAAALNAQDYHIGKRPARGPFSVRDYCDRLLEAFKESLSRAVRNAYLERIYLVVGGDLVHVDGYDGATTRGTPQDLAVSPSEALEAAIRLATQMVDLARQATSRAVLVPVMGNHDKVLSRAVFHAARQRFHGSEDVSALKPDERVYETYGDHLLCFTHGDMKKKVMRRVGDLITAEARELVGRTRWTTLFTGHLHHEAKDLIDESGRLHLQAPSPSPTDRWHSAEGYTGSRRGVQLHLIEPDTISRTDITVGV